MVADTLELENAAAPNTAAGKKPRNREVSSRYKTAFAAPSRRFPSPNIGRSVDAAAGVGASASAAPDAPKRAFSAERKRDPDDVSRSVSIDPALKPAANGGRPRAATPERKRRQQQQIDQAENARPLENVGKPEKEIQIQKWPATANGKSISRSMDLSMGRMSSIGTRGNRCLAPVRSLNQLLVGKTTGKTSDPAADENPKARETGPAPAAGVGPDDTKRVRRSVDEASCCGTDEFGSENGEENVSVGENHPPPAAPAAPAAAAGHTVKNIRPVRGTVVPARFWQDLNNRIRRLSDVNQLRASIAEVDGSRTVRRSTKVSSAPTSAHSSAGNSPAGNPTPWIYSPVRAPPAPPPPLSPSGSTKVSSPSRALPSPTRTRPSGGVASQGIRPGSVACMLNFGGDVSRSRKNMSQQEEAQYLRILHNRWLQWRFVNARAESTLSSQQATGERLLYRTSMQISDLQSRVAQKRIRLQKARLEAKVDSSIASHGHCLEDWDLLEQEHSSCLSGATEALEAATLKVPVIGGAKIDAQTLKVALNSAAEAMAPLDSTAGALLPRAEKTGEIVRQLAQTSAQGKALLQECGELLDRIAALETEDRSLRSHFVQLEKEKKHRHAEE